jgi:hypothetical protein
LILELLVPFDETPRVLKGVVGITDQFQPEKLPGSMLDPKIASFVLEDETFNLLAEQLQEFPPGFIGTGFDFIHPEFAVGSIESALGQQKLLGEMGNAFGHVQVLPYRMLL